MSLDPRLTSDPEAMIQTVDIIMCKAVSTDSTTSSGNELTLYFYGSFLTPMLNDFYLINNVPGSNS
jgi:hypothetical protein